jgi:hypothetical protein
MRLARYEQLRIGPRAYRVTLSRRNEREVDMEHRWGLRRTLDVGVKLYVRPRLPGFGRLRNASSSGAYVATSIKLPIMTRVHVALGWDNFQRGGRHRIAAYVVRSDAAGIGIEWQEFGPPPVLALIDALEVLPSRQARRTARLEPTLPIARPFAQAARL